MIREDLVQMAQESGLAGIPLEPLEHFAELVAVYERQACIDIVKIEHIAKPEIVRAIRQRGND